MLRCLNERYYRDIYVTYPRIHGNDVELVQRLLTYLGYRDAGEIDGCFGPESESAIKRFQKDIGIRVSGIADKKTFEYLVEKQGAYDYFRRRFF